MKIDKNEINVFINDYVDEIKKDNAAIFIGSGISHQAGYLSWSEFLKDKANELNLDINKEHDLISLAQYYVNKRQRTKLDESIRNEFSAKKEPTENHRILVSLPIKEYWTTNYDRIIEKTFDDANKKLQTIIKDRDVTYSLDGISSCLYKMHGDCENPSEAVILRRDYEEYGDKHEMMLAKFKGDMCSKTFLFLGYSFRDPDIHHILARIKLNFGEEPKQHYCIMRMVKKREEDGSYTKDYDYKKVKQELMIKDFKQYGINVILVNNYDEITTILLEIRRRLYKKNIMISGAYEEETMNKDKLDILTGKLCKDLVLNNYHINSGFGKNIGSYVIKGVFDGCVNNSQKTFEEAITIYPFPYKANLSGEKRSNYYTKLRTNMVKNTGITIVICGEKKDNDGKLINSNGCIEEVKLCKKQNNLIIPIGATGGAALEIWNEMKEEKDIGYNKNLFKKLNKNLEDIDSIIKAVKDIIYKYTNQ